MGKNPYSEGVTMYTVVPLTTARVMELERSCMTKNKWPSYNPRPPERLPVKTSNTLKSLRPEIWITVATDQSFNMSLEQNLVETFLRLTLETCLRTCLLLQLTYVESCRHSTSERSLLMIRLLLIPLDK